MVLVGLLLATLDGREVIHQASESNAGLLVLALVTGLLHLGGSGGRRCWTARSTGCGRDELAQPSGPAGTRLDTRRVPAVLHTTQSPTVASRDGARARAFADAHRVRRRTMQRRVRSKGTVATTCMSPTRRPGAELRG